MEGDEVRVDRGGFTESVHRVAWCLTQDGRVTDSSDAGAADLPVFMRSVAKPLQALPAVRAGVLERFRLGERHLALACASHGGGAAHLEAVREILGACGRTESDLECGPGEPRDPRAALELSASGEQPTRVQHNCSGKHAFGLAMCVAQGWPTRGYVEPGHVLQVTMRESIAEALDLPEEELADASDGCGMRTYRVPLARIASAYGRLAGGELGPAGGRAVSAMRGHSRLVAFAGGVDAELMAAEPGLVAKIGAEGLIAIGLPDGRGLALKVLDGAVRALDPAAVAAARGPLGLRAAGAALDELAAPPVLNSRGEVVGHARAHLGGADA
jgi:L-asparaginase II